MSDCPTVNLIVIRSKEIDRAAEFYQQLGLALTKHRHGNGPLHYSACVNGIVFELYPLGVHPPTVGTRVGFCVDDLSSTLHRLTAIGAEVVSGPAESEWGFRAVLKDPDGHVVELVDAPGGK